MIASFVTCASSSAFANWTLNIGYQNPIVSTWGLNFLYLGSQWGVELGVGWIDANARIEDDDDDKNSEGSTSGESGEGASLQIAGDIDVKYFFASGTARPFLQGGFGLGFDAESGEGIGAGTGGGFFGVGILLGSPALHGYGAFNVNGSDDSFFQAGLGVDI